MLRESDKKNHLHNGMTSTLKHTVHESAMRCPPPPPNAMQVLTLIRITPEIQVMASVSKCMTCDILNRTTFPAGRAWQTSPGTQQETTAVSSQWDIPPLNCQGPEQPQIEKPTCIELELFYLAFLPVALKVASNTTAHHHNKYSKTMRKRMAKMIMYKNSRLKIKNSN